VSRTDWYGILCSRFPFRDRSSRDVAHSDRDCDLGATATNRIAELDSPSDLGGCDREFLLMDYAYWWWHWATHMGAVLLAIS